MDFYDTLKEKIGYAERERDYTIKRAKETCDAITSQLEDVVFTFEETGVISLPKRVQCHSVSDMAHQLLEVSGRARLWSQWVLITIPGMGGGTRRELSIPSTKRLVTLCSGLQLLAADGCSAGENSRVVSNHSSRTNRFYFVGDEGEQIFQDWLQQCRTDPVFRVALQLPLMPGNTPTQKDITQGGNDETVHD